MADRARLARNARWVPWVLLLVELVITCVVIGILSIVLVVQFTLTPGAVLGEFDGIFTWAVSLGFDAAVEMVAVVFVFLMTGLVVAAHHRVSCLRAATWLLL